MEGIRVNTEDEELKMLVETWLFMIIEIHTFEFQSKSGSEK